MNWNSKALTLIVLLVLTTFAQSQERKMVVTIDDLPVVKGGSIARQRAVTHGILRHLSDRQVQAIGFVNEKKLGTPPKPEFVALLRAWLKRGHELGNHTFSHPRFFTTPYDEYVADTAKGHKVSKKLLAEFGKTIRYFRHPYLSTGPSKQAKDDFEKTLKRWNYEIAPVTIDNSEWKFAHAYDKANGNQARRDKIVKAYLDYMVEMTEFYEKYSRDLIGEEPPQILLIHANALNAHHLGSLLDRFSKRGYEFITLEEALKHPVYSRKDDYVGPKGISWLQRWAISEGRKFRPEPTVPHWIE